MTGGGHQDLKAAMPEAALRWIRNSLVSFAEASGASPLDKGNADVIKYTSFSVTTLSRK